MGIPGEGRIGARSPVFPSVGLLYAQVLLLLVLPGVMVFSYSWGYDHRSVGLVVHLLRGDLPRTQSSPCIEAWVVRVDSEEKWYLNSKKVSPTELPTLLSERLGLHTNCIVYLDVDSGVPYTVAIHAIELVQETQASVVLLTPETKKIHVP
jgi:biopolymer transport protein ExbD